MANASDLRSMVSGLENTIHVSERFPAVPITDSRNAYIIDFYLPTCSDKEIESVRDSLVDQLEIIKYDRLRATAIVFCATEFLSNTQRHTYEDKGGWARGTVWITPTFERVSVMSEGMPIKINAVREALDRVKKGTRGTGGLGYFFLIQKTDFIYVNRDENYTDISAVIVKEPSMQYH